MAIFTSTAELNQQKKRKNFKKMTGWKVGAMAIMGHTATGEKNAFGRYLGGSVGMTLGANLLAEGDAEEVMESQQEAEIGHQIGVGKFVGSIMGASAGGGGGGGAGGAAGGGASGMAASGGAGAGASGAATTSTSSGMLSGNSTAAKLNIGQGGGKAGRQSRRDARKGGDSMFANSDGAKTLSEADYVTGQEATLDEMNRSAEGDDFDDPSLVPEGDGSDYVNDSSGSTDLAKSGADLTEGIALAGEGLNLYAEKQAIADAYTNKRKEIAGRTYQGNAARRV